MITSKAETYIANIKLDSLGTGTINAHGVDITYTKVGANSDSTTANTFAVIIATSKMRNNIISIDNALVISIAGDYLKELEWINIWKFLRLSSIEAKRQVVK